MKRVYSIALVLLVTSVTLTTPASAQLRVPQIAVSGGALQGYLNGLGESINVATDQQNIQRWRTTSSGNSSLTLQIELSANAASNSMGIYNAAAVAPALYQVLPGAAGAGWFAVASFRSGPVRLVATLFDQNANFQGSSTYLGVTADDFGFYLQGPGGTFFTQDARQPGNRAQALVFAGTGRNLGCWWLGFEDQAAGQSDNDFDDAVLFLESVNPTPVNRTSWGSLKARFR